MRDRPVRQVTGVEVEGTPQNVDGSVDDPFGAGSDEGDVSGATGGLCGAGLANMLPFMLAGLVAMGYSRRR